MKRILCWLGLHGWEIPKGGVWMSVYDYLVYKQPGIKPEQVLRRECRFCRKVEYKPLTKIQPWPKGEKTP